MSNDIFILGGARTPMADYTGKLKDFSALELGAYNIRVNSVNPTVVMTEMSAFYWGREDIGGPFLEQMPLVPVTRPLP